jgi:hypothetical protein
MENNEVKDKELWEDARERASFKVHLITYILVNIFLWIIWAFVKYVIKSEHVDQDTNSIIPWPLYPLAGWGIGLIFHYMKVFHWKHKWTQKEYEKLVKQKEKANTDTNT